MTHRELQADLAQALQAQKRLVLQEVDLCSRWANVDRKAYGTSRIGGTAGDAGAPRLDVLRVSESYARFETFAYEVKATRADFLSDMRSGKWRQYLPYCHRLFFAVEYGICDAAEVPPECGLIMHRKSGRGWQTVRQAPVRTELLWSTETFLAVLFSLQRQPRLIDERLRRVQGAASTQFYRGAKLIGEEFARWVARAKALKRALEQEDSNICTTCGAWHPNGELRREQQQRLEQKRKYQEILEMYAGSDN